MLWERLKSLDVRRTGLSQASSERLSRRLSSVAFVVITVLVAYQLAELTWALVPGSEVSAAGAVSSKARVATSGDQPLDLSPVLQAHLFGQAGRPPAARSKQRVVDAPETKLDLVLHGVFFSAETKEARAIISPRNGEDKAYGVGGSLPGNATVEEIQVDRVLLRRGGRLEVLSLVKDKDLAKRNVPPRVASKKARRRFDYRSNRQLARTLGRYRRQAQENPGSLADIARIQPMDEGGRFVGYRLAAGKDPRVLRRFGLRPGDVLVGVNGIELSAPEKGLDAIKELTQASDIQLEVLRNGQPLSFSFKVEL